MADAALKEEIKTCETCKKQFLIIPQEQEFYKKKDDVIELQDIEI